MVFCITANDFKRGVPPTREERYRDNQPRQYTKATKMRTALFGLGLLVGLSRAAALNKRAVLADCLAETGIAMDQLDSKDWEMDTRPFNSLLPYKPDAVAVPTTAEQIQNAVVCGAQSGYKVTPKSGGHSYASYGLGGEDGHLVIQLDRMFAVKLDTKTNIATVEPGTRLGHLAVELWAQGKRAIAHGTCPGYVAITLGLAIG